MQTELLAKALAASLKRNQTRGLVDEAAGMTDVVIHGRVDLLSVADDLVAMALHQSKPAPRSWATWFELRVGRCREGRRRERQLAHLRRRVAAGADTASAALDRLRLRHLGGEP